MKEITIDKIVYVPKSETKESAVKKKGMRYVIIRTENAGVHAGYLKSRDGKEVELIDARRLWYWSGAASLSQLAMEGTSDPDNCKFPCKVNSIELTGAIEIIDVTKEAYKSIKNVKVWES